MRAVSIRMPRVTAANATPFNLKIGTMDPDSAISFRFNASAYTIAGDHKTWVGSSSWHRVGTTAPVVTPGGVAPATQATVGAAAWTITAAASGNDVVLTVTLAAGVRLDIRIDPVYGVG